MGTPQKPYILETIGSAVALLDYDHDGWLDIYLVNGSTYERLSHRTPRSSITTTMVLSPTWLRLRASPMIVEVLAWPSETSIMTAGLTSM
jgi:hypothetical protein